MTCISYKRGAALAAPLGGCGHKLGHLDAVEEKSKILVHTRPAIQNRRSQRSCVSLVLFTYTKSGNPSAAPRWGGGITNTTSRRLPTLAYNAAEGYVYAHPKVHARQTEGNLAQEQNAFVCGAQRKKTAAPCRRQNRPCSPHANFKPRFPHHTQTNVQSCVEKEIPTGDLST